MITVTSYPTRSRGGSYLPGFLEAGDNDGHGMEQFPVVSFAADEQ